jgi:hypothetical protein
VVEETSGRVEVRRHIGKVGTTARLLVGIAFSVFGAFGQSTATASGRLVGIDFAHLNINGAALAIGLIGLPAVTVSFQWLRSRRARSRLDATGPVSAMVNIVVTLGLVLVTTYLVPSISFIGFGAVVFYGASMLLAAFRGYAGCEVLAVSNWILHRDDQIGCLLLSPIDHWEQSSALT